MTGTEEWDLYSCSRCLLLVCEELPPAEVFALVPSIFPTLFTIVANERVREWEENHLVWKALYSERQY